jgi:hypothetical protein
MKKALLKGLLMLGLAVSASSVFAATNYQGLSMSIAEATSKQIVKRDVWTTAVTVLNFTDFDLNVYVGNDPEPFYLYHQSAYQFRHPSYMGPTYITISDVVSARTIYSAPVSPYAMVAIHVVNGYFVPDVTN